MPKISADTLWLILVEWNVQQWRDLPKIVLATPSLPPLVMQPATKCFAAMIQVKIPKIKKGTPVTSSGNDFQHAK